MKTFKPAKQIKPSKEQLRITTNREFAPGSLVRVKVKNNESPLRGKVLARADFSDIYQWYVVKLRGFKGYAGYMVARHDNMTIRKPVKKARTK